MSITIWNRLEARPRSLNIERALRAEIRDPLWMLSRQWQFGEFLATDAGSAILSRVRYEQSALTEVQLGTAEAEAYTDQFPLEAIVERQSILPDLKLRLETGRYWLRLLKKHLPAAQAGPIIRAFREDARWHFHLPPDRPTEEKLDQAQFLANRALMQRLRAVAHGRMLDGLMLFVYLTENANHRASDFLSVPNVQVDELGTGFVSWLEKTYGRLGPDKNAWQANRLEYSCSGNITEADGTQRRLSADAHTGGSLDWYQFDYTGSTTSNTGPAPAQSPKTKVLIPTPATYPGMPVARYWELENHRVNFGNIEAGATDTAKLIFAQFGLLYGNDWLCLPLELPLGHVHRISELEITDVFGQRVRIPQLHHKGRDEYWGFFQIHDRQFSSGKQNDGGLWLPPVVSRPQHGDPLEKVVFIRDEMANMVWAIEHTIPDGSGSSMDGFEQAQRVQDFIRSLLPPDAPDLVQENDALFHYRLVSEVAENWIPFIPVKIADSIRDIQLQRAAMPRVIPNHSTRRIRPQTTILQEGGFQSPYYIFEEEVPRAGAMVTQQWNRCRRQDGGVVVWLSRTTTNGRGEQSSGLQYDFLEEGK